MVAEEEVVGHAEEKEKRVGEERSWEIAMAGEEEEEGGREEGGRGGDEGGRGGRKQ